MSDPIANIEVAKEAIRAATGKRPNVVVMGPAVLKSLRQHPKIIDRIKYTGRDVPTLELLAALFGVSQVLVGDAISAGNTGTFSDVWGKFVAVAYTEQAGMADMGRPTFGYTYQLSGYPFVEAPRYDADTSTNAGWYGGGNGQDSTAAAAYGAVRIIWPGIVRQFPSTRTADE